MSGTLTKTESTLRFFDNPHFVEYERGLLELMRLISDGLGDSSEAEALRDKMESAWRELDSAEIARLDGLSADLFVLEKQSIPSHGDTSSEGMAVAEVRHAWEREDWDGLLRALRSHSL